MPTVAMHLPQGKWGTNHAGDAVVTRYARKRDTESGATRTALEMVAIRRKDTGEWALPGGMQDPGEVCMDHGACSVQYAACER